MHIFSFSRDSQKVVPSKCVKVYTCQQHMEVPILATISAFLVFSLLTCPGEYMFVSHLEN